MRQGAMINPDCQKCSGTGEVSICYLCEDGDAHAKCDSTYQTCSCVKAGPLPKLANPNKTVVLWKCQDCQCRIQHPRYLMETEDARMCDDCDGELKEVTPNRK